MKSTNEIFNLYKPDDYRFIFLIRHAHRGSDTSRFGDLTNEGETESQNLGGEFSIYSNKNFGWISSGFLRTSKTAYNIAKPLNVELIKYISGINCKYYDIKVTNLLTDKTYVKNKTKFKLYNSQLGSSWNTISRYAYDPNIDDIKDAFYNIEEASEKIKNKLIELSGDNDISFAVSHDQVLVPFFANYVNVPSADELRYYSNKKWLGYLSGVCIIINKNTNNVVYEAYKGYGNGYY